MINFSWFLFRKDFSITQLLEIGRIIRRLFDERQNELEESFSNYNFDSYFSNLHRINENDESFWIESDLLIIRKEGTYEYKVPLIRSFLGSNNIFIYLNRIESNNFPNVVSNEVLPKTIQNISHSFKKEIELKYHFKEMEDYFFQSGLHNCIINCGECCDGADNTRSTLQDGVYCSALSRVGKFCLFQSLNIKLPVGHDICSQYICSEVSQSLDSSETNNGTHLKSFVPKYHLDDVTEMFKIIELILSKKSLSKKLFRNQEEQAIYWSAINPISEFLSEIKTNDKYFYDRFITLIYKNKFDECINEFNQNYEIPKKLSSEIENNTRINVVSHLEELILWYDSYRSRRERYSNLEIYISKNSLIL